MFLKKLSILNYKNLTEAEVEFSPRLNCLVGQNGQGKTNLLDAIYFLSFCKSHTTALDSQVIRHEADTLMLQGWYEEDGKTTEYLCGVKRHQRKVFKRDKKAYVRLSEHIGRIPLVMVSPFDEDLIREGSQERRRFMDMAISQYDMGYMQSLVAYNEALQQRNALLRDESRSYGSDLYEIYEIPMDEHAREIFRKRLEFVEAFLPVFRRYYRCISGRDEEIDLSYVSHLSEGGLLEQLQTKREKDRLLGFTSRGIHKDDLDISLGGFPIQREGSQGQNKSCLIAMKLAQYDFLRSKSRHTPLLLLDDLFDKLDDQRLDNIIRLVSQEEFGQIFITDTHYEHLDNTLRRVGGDYRVFAVENGVVNPMEQP